MGVEQPEWRLERALFKELRKDPACLAVVTQLHMPSRRRPDLVAVMTGPEGVCLLVIEIKPKRADVNAAVQLLDYVAEIKAGLDTLGVTLPVAGAIAAPAFTDDLIAWEEASRPLVRLITIQEKPH